MQLHAKQNGRKFRISRGVSLIEFVGCLAAMGGGVVFGSLYLGVDVQALAAGILEKADIGVPAILSTDSAASTLEASEELPASDFLEASEPSAVAAAVETATPLELESEALALPLAAETVGGGETASDSAARKELTDAEKLTATQGCWLAINECIQAEVGNRLNWVNVSQSWQLFDFLLHRQKGHQKVVETIEQFDLHGVDPRLRAYIRQVLAWHRAGSELFERAAQLLTDAPAGKLTGPFAQSWQSAATQHRMEEKLILNKHAAVANYLEHVKKMSATATSP